MASTLARLRGVPRDTLLFLAYVLAANIALGTFTLVFNLYLLELSFKEDFIGLAASLQTGAMAVTAFTQGRLLGRWGVWRVVLISLIIYAGLSAALSLATAGYLILLLSLLWGGASSFVIAAVMPFVVELSDERGRQRVASLAVSTSMAATTLGSLIGGWMPRLVAMLMDVERASVPAFRGALITATVVAALGAIPLLAMSGERRRPAADDDEDDGRAGAPATGRGLPQATTSVQRQRLMVFVLVGGIMSVGAGMTQPFFNVYLLSIGAQPGQIGLIFAGASIFAAFTTLFSPRLVEWFGSERAVAFGRSSPVPFYLLLVFVPGVGVAALAHLVRTASQGLGWSVESAYMSVALRGKARRAIFGYRSGAWNVGYAITSLLGGVIIVRWGYNPTFVIYSLTMLAAMTLFYVYARYISPVESPEEAPAVAESAAPLAEEPALQPDGGA